MHDIVAEQFEKHLNGEASQAFHDHIASCAACRAETAELSRLSALLRDFRPDGEREFQPPPGFYNRLAGRIIADQQREAWGFFSPGVVFFRRVAFASLLLLACLGSYLVTREASETGTDAVTIMAQHDAFRAHPESADRDGLLVTLANYRE
jgi:hypothetical protein